MRAKACVCGLFAVIIMLIGCICYQQLTHHREVRELQKDARVLEGIVRELLFGEPEEEPTVEIGISSREGSRGEVE